MRRRRYWKKPIIISLAFLLAAVLSLCGVSVLFAGAEENGGDPAYGSSEDAMEPEVSPSVILAFAPLDLAPHYAAADAPASQEELPLPEALSATVAGQEDSIDVPVTWSPDIPYTGALGEVVFTAVIGEDYTLAEDVPAPTVTVMVSRFGAGGGMLRAAAEDPTEMEAGSLTALLDAIPEENAGITRVITLTAEITFDTDEEYTLDGTGNDITILRGATGYMFTIPAGASLTLKNITIDGGSGSITSSSAFSLLGTMTIEEGAAIQNNFSTKDSGGVTITNNANLTMTGGEIAGNTTTQSGGGVYMINGTFTMSGGTISGNKSTEATGGGGGVYVKSGIFTMSGGTISGNDCKGGAYGGGGGVRVTTYGKFVMSGGSITGNTSENEGGGVFCSAAAGLYFGGTAVVQNNTANGAVDNTYLYTASCYVYFGNGANGCAAPETGMRIGIMKWEAGVIMDSGANSGDEKYFASDDTAYGVVYTGGKLQLSTGVAVSGLSVSQQPNTLIYNGTAQIPAFSVSYSGTLLTENTHYAVTGSQTNAGTYTATIRGLGRYTGTKSETFTISQRNISNVTIADLAATYTGTAQTPALTLTDSGGGITAADYSAAYSNNTGAGTATVTLTPTPSGNYTGDAISKDFTITPAVLTVTADNKTITFGAQSPAYTYTITGFVNSENAVSADVTGTSTLSSTYIQGNNAGNYPIAADGNFAAANYRFAYAEGTLTVGKAAQTALVMPSPGDKLYGDAAFTLTTTGGSGTGTVTFSSSDETVLSVSGSTATIKGAGEVTITAAKAESTNYLAAQSDSVGITVSPRDIAGAAITVTSTHIYTGAAQTPTYTVSDTGAAITSGDYTAAITNNTNAGTATITLAGTGNYTGTKTKTFAIGKAAQTALTLTAPTEKTYGDAAFTLAATGGNGTGSVTYVSSNPAVLSVTGNTAAILKAGTAAITATKAGDTNYITKDSDTLAITVAPRDISHAGITVSGSYIYTGAAQTPTYTVSDTGAAITSGDYAAAYSDNTNAGTATITLTGQGNYTGTKTRTFAIGKKALTVTAEDQTIPYGAAAPTYTIAYTGFANGEDERTITGSPALSCSYKKGYNVGGYFIDVDASELSAQNYTINASSGRLQVEKTAGAAVSGALSAAEKTTASITVAAVANAAEEEQALMLEESEYAVQAVEYALSTSSTPPATGWQDSTTFTDLSSATTYYAFARTAANINYDAGTIQRSEAIETDGKFAVTLSVQKDGSAYESHGKTFYLKQGEISFTGTGSDGTVTFAEIPEGATYNIFDGDTNTGATVTVTAADATATLDYYTVTFAVREYGAAYGSTVKAVYGNVEIASSSAVLGGKSLTLTATGNNASTYTYSWRINGEAGEQTDSITLTNLANTVNAVCTVTGAAESSYEDSSSYDDSSSNNNSSSSSSSSSSSASESSQAAQSSAVESSVAESSAAVESSVAESSVAQSSIAEESSVAESSIAESSAVESSVSEAVSEAVIESESVEETTYESSNSYESYESYSDAEDEDNGRGIVLFSGITEAMQVTEEAVAVVSEIFSGARTPVGPAMDLHVDIAVGAVVTGREIMLTAKGLKPFTDVKLTVYSEPQVLGIATADENGEASLWATLPEGLEQGAHTVVAEGIGTLDEPIQSVSMFQIDDQSVVVELLPPSQLSEPVDPGDKTLIRAMEAGKPIYDPARNPGTVAGATVAICVTGGGFAAMAGLKKPGDNPPNRNERRRASKKGAGDKGFLWRILPFSKASDLFFIAAQEKTATFSFTLHRMLTDGVWARAMFGSGGILLWMAGAVLGVVASAQVGFRALTPDFRLVLAIVALGLLDASAGFVSWLTMALLSLFTGHVTGLQDVCTLLGMFTLFTALMTLSSIRPLHREYEPGKKFIYDRIMDYIIPTVYLILSSSAVLDVINGLSGLELFTEENGMAIKIVSVLALWVRLAFEDIATNLFPSRCHRLHADTEFSQSPPFIVGSIALYITTFILISVPFFEFSSMLMILLALDMIPALAQYFEDKLPNSKFLNHWYPDPDSPYISLAMIIIDIYLTLWLLSGITDYRQMSMAMILLALPAAVAEIPALFGREGYISKNKWTGRIAEFGCWAVFALIALDIVKLV